MSQPFFLFSWGSASHPWLPSCLNSLLWWTKCHLYKSFCLNSSTVSVDLTLRSCTWSLRACRYWTSLLYGLWPYPRQLGVCRQWNKAMSSPSLTKAAELLPSNFTSFQPPALLLPKKDWMPYKCCLRGTNECIWAKCWASFSLHHRLHSTEIFSFFFWGKLLFCTPANPWGQLFICLLGILPCIMAYDLWFNSRKIASFLTLDSFW